MSRPDVAWRALADARRALVAWAVCVALLALVLVSVYPAVRDQAADLTKLLDSYPDAMKAFFGLSGVDYSTGAGYLQSEVFGLTGPLLLLVLAVGRGASAIAGEEERGTLDLLLATPVSRTRVVLEKAAAGALQVAAIGAVLWLALAGGATAFGLGIGLWRLAAAVLLTVLVAEVFGAVALAVGARTGHRGLAIGVATALAIGTYVLDSLAQIVGALEPWRWLSPFAYYREAHPLSGGLTVREPAVLVLLAVAGLVVAVTSFRRRDVRSA